MALCTRKGPRCQEAALVHVDVGPKPSRYTGISRCIPCSPLALSASEQVQLEDELRGVGLDRDEDLAGGDDAAMLQVVPRHGVQGAALAPEQARVARRGAPRATPRVEPGRSVEGVVGKDEALSHRGKEGGRVASPRRRGTAAKARGA